MYSSSATRSSCGTSERSRPTIIDGNGTGTTSCVGRNVTLHDTPRKDPPFPVSSATCFSSCRIDSGCFRVTMTRDFLAPPGSLPKPNAAMQRTSWPFSSQNLRTEAVAWAAVIVTDEDRCAKLNCPTHRRSSPADVDQHAVKLAFKCCRTRSISATRSTFLNHAFGCHETCAVSATPSESTFDGDTFKCSCVIALGGRLRSVLSTCSTAIV